MFVSNRPLKMGKICCPETSVTTNLRCVTPQKAPGYVKTWKEILGEMHVKNALFINNGNIKPTPLYLLLLVAKGVSQNFYVELS